MLHPLHEHERGIVAGYIDREAADVALELLLREDILRRVAGSARICRRQQANGLPGGVRQPAGCAPGVLCRGGAIPPATTRI